MGYKRKSQTFGPIFYKFWVLVFVSVCCVAGAGRLLARGGCPPQGPKLSAEQYCKLYAEEAQRQMRQYGIPASITLAQGMYESAYGSSYLAVKANNHFGIKAYRNWSGPVVRCDDDAAREPFCKFKSVEQGYEHHSKFLRDNTRYAPLFKLDVRDYEAWARGLKRCGYATDPRYAEHIISIIERYHLDVYDTERSAVFPRHKLYSTARRRGLKYVRTLEGDDLAMIAKEYGTSARRLRKYNDLPRGYVLREGEVIYLQSKRKRADRAHPTHTVSAGESLHSISQRYGIKVSSLMDRNDLKSGVVEPGQVLKLR